MHPAHDAKMPPMPRKKKQPTASSQPTTSDALYRTGQDPPHGITEWLGDTPLPPNAIPPLDTHLVTSDPLPTESVAEDSIDTQDTKHDNATQAHVEQPQDKAEQPAGDSQEQNKAETPEGDTDSAVPSSSGNGDGSRTHIAYAVAKRLQKEGRWAEVEPVRDRMIREAKAGGMDKAAAQAWTYAEIDRLYPPLEPKGEPPPVVTETPEPSSRPVPGLYLVPSEWPSLPNNAALSSELGWVQAERLRVVEDRGNSTVVHLERASIPAPSMAALGWLETSIRSYAKYIDIVAKSLSSAVDEQDAARRERLRIDDIQALLSEMHEDKQ